MEEDGDEDLEDFVGENNMKREIPKVTKETTRYL